MKKEFNSAEAKRDMILWVREWFAKKAEGRKAVVGMSGGRDSAIAAAMLVEALGKDNVIGVILPYKYADTIEDIVKIAELLDIEFHVIYIRRVWNELESEIRDEVGPLSDGTKAYLHERIRMTALAGIVSNKKGIFVNTSNLSEDWLGYYTRYGDISPFLELTITEVKAIGKELGLADEYIDPLPVDGLWGLIDESQLGFSYKTMDDYIRHGIHPDPEIKERIDTLNENSELKREEVSTFHYEFEE